MLNWFLTGPDKPRIQDKNVVRKMYHTARFQAVTAMILGYGMYYVMRMTLGVAKKPMLEDGFTPTELGMMGAGMLVAIAIGKCANGFIADHCNIYASVFIETASSFRYHITDIQDKTDR